MRSLKDQQSGRGNPPTGIHFFYLTFVGFPPTEWTGGRWELISTNVRKEMCWRIPDFFFFFARATQELMRRPRIQEPICYLLCEPRLQSRVNPTANHRLTLDLWLAKDNRFLNPKSSYKRILMAPPCRLIQNQLTTIVVPVFDWQLILMESRPWSPGTWGCHHPFVGKISPGSRARTTMRESKLSRVYKSSLMNHLFSIHC